MKKRFWVSIFFISFTAVAVMGAGGLYFSSLKETQLKKASFKKQLSRQSHFYLKELDKKFLDLISEAEKLLVEKDRKRSSLFSALAFIDEENNFTESFILDNPSLEGRPLMEKTFKDFERFTDTIKQDKISSPARFEFLPDSETSAEWIVFILNTPPPSWKGEKNLRVAGLIKAGNMFKFSKTSDREALIINSQGRLFFSFHPEPTLPPATASLRKFFENEKPAGWYMKRKEKGQGNNFFHIKSWPESNLFVLTGGRFSAPLFPIWTKTGGQWLLFCAGVLIFFFMGLYLAVRTLFSAYEILKEDLSRFVNTKQKTFLSKTKNPFLHFYKNLSLITPSGNLSNGKNHSHRKPQTLQELLDFEEKKLKRKFPGFGLTTEIDSNIKLNHFHPQLKTVLHELLLNAIESMGSSETQNITARSRTTKKDLHLTIEDRGSGLKEGEEKAFELYHSTKSQLGVGLNVAQSIVSSKGGQIKLTPLDEGGLSARVSLPLTCFQQPTPNDSRQINEPTPSAGQKSVGQKNDRLPPAPPAFH